MTRVRRVAAIVALAVAGLSLAGCVMPDKGVTGVFPPESIAAPPSVRSDPDAPDTAPKARAAAEPRSARGLSVPRQP